MAYKNKKSAKRKHRKYSRRSKKGGVITLVINSKNPRASRKSPSTKKEVSEAQTIKAVADDYTRLALEDALSTFSRQAQEPVITLTTTSNRRPQNKRDGPTASQIEKAQQKALEAQQKALKAQQKAEQKALKEQEKSLAKQLKEEQKEEANKHKVHTKAANDVTTSAINQAFLTLFNEPSTKTRAK